MSKETKNEKKRVFQKGGNGIGDAWCRSRLSAPWLNPLGPPSRGAGDNNAITAPQLRGAKLFFTPATNGGAGCFSCHSGPMLNKQVNDPDLTGTGQFVDENFFNIGLSDHPVPALNREARNNPDFIDNGGMEIARLDIYKFRATTMRQLKGSKFFFHNGTFTNVRDVVQYFNAGVPQTPVTGAASTLTPRFTNPRGAQRASRLGAERTGCGQYYRIPEERTL